MANPETPKASSIDIVSLRNEYNALTSKQDKVERAKKRVDKVVNGSVSLSTLVDNLKDGKNLDNPAFKEVVMGIQAALSILGYNVGGVDGIWGKNSKAALDAFLQKYNYKTLTLGSFKALADAVGKAGELDKLSNEVGNLNTYQFGKKNKVEKKDVVSLIDSLPNPFKKLCLEYVKKNDIKRLQHYLNDIIGKVPAENKKKLVDHLKNKGIWLVNDNISEDNKFGPQTLETIKFMVDNPYVLWSYMDIVGLGLKASKDLTELKLQVDKKPGKKGGQDKKPEVQNKNDVKLYGWRKMEKVKMEELKQVIGKLNVKYPQYKSRLDEIVKNKDVKGLQVELNKILGNMPKERKARIKKILESKGIWLSNDRIYEDGKLGQQTMEVLKSFLDN